MNNLKRMTAGFLSLLVLIFCANVVTAEEGIIENSLGMKMVLIKPGTFMMGQAEGGEFDEKPVHKVNITEPFYMASTEVTNRQYEQFDPSHKKLRGSRDFTMGDDEAVIFVSWYDAVGFCKWLSEKEGRPYRLPTEAEWEFACRAGTTTNYYTGDELPEVYHNNQQLTRGSKATTLFVGRTPPNKWGLYDMHGNVEEWCLDWYGPYEADEQGDPVGRVDGEFRVTRGGSHSTRVKYLRSANRLGAMPDDNSWVIGFRVVCAAMPKGKPLPVPPVPDFLKSIKQNVPVDLKKGPPADKPYFRGPRQYVKIQEGSMGPLFSEHNHDPAMAECPNGDIMAIWYTTYKEPERRLAIAASRLRYGNEQWDDAYLFWDIPDRNDHAPSMFTDNDGTIWHFNGEAGTGGWGTLIVIMRKSKDNGATWSKAKIIMPGYGRGHQPIESTFRTSRGDILLPSDNSGGTTIWFSKDGEKWVNPGEKIRGIHAGVAELSDGKIIAFGRGRDMDGKMPISLSSDYGKTWEYKPSEFQPVGGGQRIAFLKLKSGALFIASFCKQLTVLDAAGKERKVNGTFAALSYDDGKTWPYKRLVTDDKPTRDVGTMDGHLIKMGPFSSEPVGYLAVCQGYDDVIHLISSWNHYALNEQWVKTPAPVADPDPKPKAVSLKVKKTLTNVFKPSGPPSQADWGWIYQPGNIEETDAVTIEDDGLMRVRTGPGQQLWWRSEKAETIGLMDYKKGYTYEIRTQVVNHTLGRRGVDLEIYNGKGQRHVMTITDTGIYWYNGIKTGSGFIKFDGQYEIVAEGLDNTDGMHIYRLAVRADRVAQIYRDGQLIGSRPYEYRTPRGPYLYFGAGKGCEALIDYVSYDFAGAFQPQ